MSVVLCNFLFGIGVLLLLLLLTTSTAKAAQPEKKAIIITSFGTRFQKSLHADIGGLEAKAEKEFPGYTIFRAFTSKIVMRKLQDEGVIVNSLETTLDDLKKNGFHTVILQSAHLTPGQEYTTKIVSVAKKYKDDFSVFTIGRPIMTLSNKQNGENEPDDFVILREALLKRQIPAKTAGTEVVFMGHGSPRQHNPAYEALQAAFDEKKLQVTIGVLEKSDYPNLGAVLERLRSKPETKSVVLMPLLLTAGDHVHKDMMGEDAASWKSTLEREGYEVQVYFHGLGENPDVLDIYIQHIKDAILGQYSLSIASVIK